VIVYEVNLSVDAAIDGDYRPWLRGHVEAMCALEGFEGATCFMVDDPGPGRVAYCVQYRLKDREALDGYLASHAQAMRADGVRRFGQRFSATRRILQPLD